MPIMSGRLLRLRRQGVPLWKPPYSRVTAIDLNTGDHRWMVPMGDHAPTPVLVAVLARPRQRPAAQKLGRDRRRRAHRAATAASARTSPALRLLQRGDEIVAVKHKRAVLALAASKRYSVTAQFATSPSGRSPGSAPRSCPPGGSAGRARRPGADDQHAAAGVVQAHRVERAAQPQDHVAPALSTGRAVVELAEQPAELGLMGMAALDAGTGEPVEDAELLLAQPFVDDGWQVLGRSRRLRRSIGRCFARR